MILLAVVATSLESNDSAAQDGAAQQALVAQNRTGMEAYSRLDVDEAKRVLEAALQQAQTAGITGAPLARTHMNLGVVFIGGLGDSARALEQFRRALQLDATIELDPVTSTPEIQSLFRLARQSMSAPGQARPAGPTAPPAPAPAAPSLIRHAPAREQMGQTPTPVFVEVAPFVRVGRVDLYYRGRGMRQFERRGMRRLGNGWAGYIPCMAAFEPRVDYYVVVQDPDRRPIASAGTAEAPIGVPIVRRRSAPSASLPRLPAPEMCSESECPPGLEGCHNGPTCGNRRCEGDETTSCELDCFGTTTSRAGSRNDS
jgi:hypothetical protein